MFNYQNLDTCSFAMTIVQARNQDFVSKGGLPPQNKRAPGVLPQIYLKNTSFIVFRGTWAPKPSWPRTLYRYDKCSHKWWVTIQSTNFITESDEGTLAGQLGHRPDETSGDSYNWTHRFSDEPPDSAPPREYKIGVLIAAAPSLSTSP